MTEYMDVPRGLLEAEEIPQQRSILPEDDVEDTPDDILHGLPPTDLEEPTSYELESKASVAAWEEIRQSILHVVTESHAMQIGQKCLKCEKSALLRCVQCGPTAFLCEDCFSDLHKYINTFHVAERWEVSCCSHPFL